MSWIENLRTILPMIELQGVYKQFGELQAVKNVSFTAQKGEIFGLIGPNGAGKTTTIRMIMNILAPDSGTILFDGNPLGEKDKERLGYLPEERGLYKKVKVNEMLRYLASLKGKEASQSQHQIDVWLKKFGIFDWRDRKIEELSKGMSQKVQFIAAVAHDPELLFFDEPFAGLDPVSSDLLRDAILELGNRGKTILFSTHIMEHAEKICNRIFLINRGSEVVQGELSQIKSSYGTQSVIIEFDGDGTFIKELPIVDSVVHYPRWMEVKPAAGVDPDRLLQELVGRIRLQRYELSRPSLHNIFIQLVGEKESSDDGQT